MTRPAANRGRGSKAADICAIKLHLLIIQHPQVELLSLDNCVKLHLLKNEHSLVELLSLRGLGL